MQIKNGSDTLQLLLDSSRIGIDGTITARVASTAEYDAKIMQNGRLLGRLPKGRGQLQIRGAAIGQGQARLYAIQEHQGREVLRSRPVTIDVF
jgi:hypothetical protein